MGKRRQRRAAKRAQRTVHAPVATAEHTFHVLSYARVNGTELAKCLDCNHTEPWNKTATTQEQTA